MINTLIRQILNGFMQIFIFQANRNTHSHHSKLESQMKWKYKFVLLYIIRFSSRELRDCCTPRSKIRRLSFFETLGENKIAGRIFMEFNVRSMKVQAFY